MPTNFGFTNTTAMTGVSAVPVEIKPVANYGKVQDEPTCVMLQNKTAPLDQGELLTYRHNEMKDVKSDQVIQNPAKVRNGVQYVIKLDEIIRTTDASGAIVCDEPVVAYITIRHQKSGNISSAIVTTVLLRLLGAIFKEDGTTRFDDLMRSALVPVED